MLRSLNESARITLVKHIKQLLFMFGFGYAWLANEIGDTIAFTKLFKMRPVDYAIQNLDEKVIVQTKHCIIENLKHV